MIEERISALQRRLDDANYEVNPLDLVRFRVDAADEVIAGVIRQVIADGRDGCDRFRETLAASVEVPRIYARRRTLQAHRQSSLSMATEALDGFAMIPTDSDVPWETWVLADLFVARTLGGDMETIEDRFSSIASQRSANRFAIAVDALERVSDLARCRLAEVSTTYGLGLVENPELTDMPGFGLYPAPALGMERILYSSTTNLAQLAVTLGDEIDTSGQGVTTAIIQDQVPTTLVPAARTGPYLHTAACLRFIVDARDEASFMVYVAEMTEDDDVQELGDSAAQVDGQTAIWDERRLIVMSSQPTFDDEMQGETDFHEYEVLAQAALRDLSTR
jgi:hypothetical protein